jgi:ornithine decarboxylase
MNKTTSEPPARIQSTKIAKQRASVISLHNLNSPVYASAQDMVEKLRPSQPVHCLRHGAISRMTRWFVDAFKREAGGSVMFAVKTNPDAAVLRTISRAGITRFDVASLAEVKAVADVAPRAKMYFMHPVKSREAIYEAYFTYGVRDFSLDSHAELKKILEVTNHAEDLNLYVRLSMASDQAAYSLAGKFGVKLEEASSLIVATRNVSKKLGVCFHVGSQCMNPSAYIAAVQTVVDLLTQTGVRLDVLDIGGGFPSIYPAMTPPPLSDYMTVIGQAVSAHPMLKKCEILCEPGRALVAEGGSVVVRVELRKGNMLYINDGTFGSLFDAGVPNFLFPVKAIRTNGELSGEKIPFGFYGPTCDSMDTMNGPFYLPADINEGDWIEVGQLGAYGSVLRTKFNGFYSDETVEVSDEPLMSMYVK